MRDLVLERCNSIKVYWNGFLGDGWKDSFPLKTWDDLTHISRINFEDLDDEKLIHIYESLIVRSRKLEPY